MWRSIIRRNTPTTANLHIHNMSSTSTSNARPAPGSKGADYHRQCTGIALETVNSHSSVPANGLTIFGAAFCPFVHRVWIALEHLQIPYRYIEVDPYKKPAELIEVNPKGLVPSLRLDSPHGKTLGLAESTVILEYLNERFVDGGAVSPNSTKRLLPPLNDENVYKRARARQVSHHLNNTLIPSFYRFLQAQEEDKQVEHGRAFVDNLKWFEDRLVENDSDSDDKGPFFAGKEDIGWVDVMVAPWAYRATNVLKHFRALDLDATFPPTTSRYQRWAKAVFASDPFKRTTSTEDLYLDSYARYAENRPNTSQVAQAINSGRALP